MHDLCSWYGLCDYMCKSSEGFHGFLICWYAWLMWLIRPMWYICFMRLCGFCGLCGVCSAELTKLRAYSFVYGFRYHWFEKRARLDRNAHPCFPQDVILGWTLINVLISNGFGLFGLNNICVLIITKSVTPLFSGIKLWLYIFVISRFTWRFDFPDSSSSSGLVHVFKWPTCRVQEGTRRVGAGGWNHNFWGFAPYLRDH